MLNSESKYEIEPRILHSFEANFFKHWLNFSSHERVLLSYGFIIPLNELGYKPTDPRPRMSDRIWKVFMN